MGSAVAVDVAEHRVAAPARAAMWFAMVPLFEYPGSELVESMSDGGLGGALAEAAAGLPYPLEIPNLGDIPVDQGGLGPEYIRLFDVPAAGTPVPLYLGALGGDRRSIMEDLLRFYRHFGLSVVHAEERDLPDSVPTVLEFMGYLVEREQVDVGEDARRAQRDLLNKYLTRAAPVIRERIAAMDPPPFYVGATTLLEEFAAAEASALSAG